MFPIVLASIVAVILLCAWSIDHRTRRGGHTPARGRDVAADVRRMHVDGRDARIEVQMQPKLQSKPRE